MLEDISPLRDLPLTRLGLPESVSDYSAIASLSQLTSLTVHGWHFSDLNIVAKLPLAHPSFEKAAIDDLSPIASMSKLRFLAIPNTPVSDLSPISKLPLQTLWMHGSKVTDLSPLADMPLKDVNCYSTKVTDISVLAGKPLDRVHMAWAPVADLTPLLETPVKHLVIHPDKERSAESAKVIETLVARGCRVEYW